jgi:dinuclear metal center YbgI/SA1388 family protein
MVTVGDVAEVMEQWAPPALAETWDNPGLMTGNRHTPVSAALISLDVTIETLESARAHHANLIISHHPPIFKPLYSLAGTSLAVRVIQAAVRENIAIFSSHTNLDQAPGGVSAAAAKRLGLRSLTPLAPGRAELVKFVTFVPPEFTGRVREAAGSAGAGSLGEYRYCSFTVRGTGSYIPSAEARPFRGESGTLSLEEEERIEMIAPASMVHRIVSAVRAVHPNEEMAYDIVPLANTDSRYGYGAMGTLAQTMSGRDFLSHAADSFGILHPSFSGPLDREIRRVAVMGGSGGKYFRQAISRGADALVTGDIGYHDFLEAGDSILLIDATHRATELPVLDAIQTKLTEYLSEPIEVYIDSGVALPVTGFRGTPK